MARTPPKGSGGTSKGKRSPAKATSSSASKKKPAKPKAASRSTPSRARTTKRPPRSAASRTGGWKVWAWISLAALVTGAIAAGAVSWVDARQQVRAYVAQPHHSTPTTVWSAPIRLEPGQPNTTEDLVADLISAGYERTAPPVRHGQFSSRSDGVIEVWTPAREGPGFSIPASKGTIAIQQGHIHRVTPKDLVLWPTLFATLGDLEARRSPVTLQDVSPWMAPALLAIEDARFRDHVGVDPIGILRALLSNLRGRDLAGGSTLTQQLAKNLFLDQRRTIRRKVREVFFAAALEAELDKDALLELYLSEVYLGHVDGVPIHGVEQAARSWFGKSARALTVSECATMAGVIASPNVWSPMRDPGKALERRDAVLHRMVYVRALTEAQLDDALDDAIVTIATPPSRRWKAPWAVDAALDRVGDTLGDGFTAGAGDRVYTTIQPHLQRAAQRAVTDGLTALAAQEPGAADAEAALVSIDARTGHVVALVGGRDFIQSPFNRATRARRHPGSTIKPLVAMAAMSANPALGPHTLFDDAPIQRRFDGRTWSPKNYDGRFVGPISLAAVLEQSRNIPSVLLAEQVGPKPLQRFLVDAGLPGATDLPSAALGAFPATPMELAGAYTVFAGAGQVHVPQWVLGVEDQSGGVRATITQGHSRLTDDTTAALVAHMLQGVVTRGTARRAASLGAPAGYGGKTGTTDGDRDAWFVGIDGHSATAVWVGRDRADLGLGGSQAALPVWAAYVSDLPAPAPWSKPKGVTAAEVCDTTHWPPCPGCAARTQDWFRAGHVPPRTCTVLAAPPDVVGDAPEGDLTPKEKRAERRAAREAVRP